MADGGGGDDYELFCGCCRCCVNSIGLVGRLVAAFVITMLALLTLMTLIGGDRIKREGWLNTLSTAFVPVLTLTGISASIYGCCALCARSRKRPRTRLPDAAAKAD